MPISDALRDAYFCGFPSIDAQTAQIVEHVARLRSTMFHRPERACIRRRILELVAFTLRHAIDEEDALARIGADVAECRRHHDDLGALIAREIIRFVDGDDHAAFVIITAIEAHIVGERPALRRALARTATASGIA